MSDEAASDLGSRLLQAVNNLWGNVNRQQKVLDHHGQSIEELRREMNTLKREVHGLKTSRGKVMASNARLRSAIEQAESKLIEINNALN